MSVLSEKDLEKLFNELMWDSLPPMIGTLKLRLEFLHEAKVILEILPTNEVVLKSTDDEDNKELINCLERSGIAPIQATFMPSSATEQFKTESTTSSRWTEWISKELTNFSFICVDTNILMKSYCSNYLSEWLKGDFAKVKFRIPRLSILELERISNEEFENVTSTKKEIRQRKKRLGLLAASEVMFLKNNGAELLPLSNKALVSTFLDKAAHKMVDSWIRQEAFEFASQQGFSQVLFMTNDLVNGLAAYSEGFNTCVFSRLEHDQYFIQRSFSESSQLAKIIGNVSVSFGKLTMNVYYDGQNLRHGYEIEGIWNGKTPYHWVNRLIRVRKI